MNFSEFNFDENTVNTLKTLDNNGRIPHAIIIEGKSKEKLLETAKYLSMYAVCTSENKPCGKCPQCHKASNQSHADITYAYPEKKSKTYTIEQMRNIAKDSYIRPNEATCKIYIFEEADNRLSAIAQNSFLKLLEEPPSNVHFIMLCENAQKLLITILSRCTVIRLKSKKTFSETAINNAENIINGIISAKEYDLLLAVNSLSDKDNSADTLEAVRLIMRDGIATLEGAGSVFNEELGKSLATRFTKGRLLKMIELTEDAGIKIKQNININLLTTWLCGEYRRISWQR